MKTICQILHPQFDMMCVHFVGRSQNFRLGCLQIRMRSNGTGLTSMYFGDLNLFACQKHMIKVQSLGLGSEDTGFLNHTEPLII